MLGILLLAALALLGCQSMRDIVLAGSGGQVNHEGLAELEEIVIRLDGLGVSRAELANARSRVSALDGTLADPGFDAILAAWSGRLFLMEGKTSDARREHSRSQSLSPYNIPAQMLSFRLETDLQRRLGMIDHSLEIELNRGELLIERARALFDQNRFFESVAAFDSAFVILEGRPFYEEAYRAFREKAWELRNLAQGTGGRIVEIAMQGEMSWRDLIEVTRNETDLLRFITAGRDWPAEMIFSHLVDRAFIPPTQEVTLLEWPSLRPSAAEAVLRSGAAWFLWHLNADNRANRGLLTRYSSRFANMPNARSPIPDISINSPFIDSILGCVESQFMSLPDGRNFMPYERVKGSDFLLMIRKL